MPYTFHNCNGEEWRTANKPLNAVSFFTGLSDDETYDAKSLCLRLVQDITDVAPESFYVCADVYGHTDSNQILIVSQDNSLTYTLGNMAQVAFYNE